MDGTYLQTSTGIWMLQFSAPTGKKLSKFDFESEVLEPGPAGQEV